MHLLNVKSVSKSFDKKSLINKKPSNYVLNDVSLYLRTGEIYGLVGESGSGKTTLSRCIMGLEKPNAGSIEFQGQSIQQMHKKDYYKKVQMIFQDPLASIDPKQTIFCFLEEPLLIHSLYSYKEERSRVIEEMLTNVGMSTEVYQRFSHEFSGGQLQRIAIARALLLKPDILICDEPVSALDVSIQAQILNLLKDLNKKLSLTMLFISHDMSVIYYMADRIGVLKSGNLIEEGTKQEVFASPKEEYTKSLFG